jgi:lysophospholipase L1-like esterase
MVAKDLGLKLTNASCPGETTSSFIKQGKDDNGCTHDFQGGPGWRAAGFPLHTSYSKGQLLFAVNYLKAHPNTKLVTLQIGANDGLRCRELNGGVCEGDNLNATVATIYTNLQKILTQLTGKAGYKGQIVLVNYYSINSVDPDGTQQVQALNAAEKSAASTFSNVRVANPFSLWAYASKYTSDGTTDTCKAGLENHVTDNEGNEDCGIHPSNAGQALIATAVDRTVRKS